jgi:DNA polymerase-3 subunit beta
LSADEFPPIQSLKEDKKITLPQEKLKGMLKKTSFAISTDESRYVLNGIYISLKEHKMTMVATDGRRLAMVDEELDIPGNSQGEFIIPTKAVNELNRLLGEKGDVELKLSENQVALTLNDDKGFSIQLMSKLVEGNYPNYRQVIPNETKERIALPREELLAAVRRAQIMTSDKANSVKMALSLNNLAITANSPEVGEARESMAINYKGKEMAIAFNPAYLVDPLSALTEDEVFLELIDELSPGVFKINGPFLYVVMPMRLS